MYECQSCLFGVIRSKIDMDMMTDKTAEELDDFYTKNPPKVNPAKNSLANRPFKMMVVDDFSASYITNQARIAGKTPTAVIADMVRRQAAGQS
jgi:hypothetical protein